jgi:hypothetical protein
MPLLKSSREYVRTGSVFVALLLINILYAIFNCRAPSENISNSSGWLDAFVAILMAISLILLLRKTKIKTERGVLLLMLALVLIEVVHVGTQLGFLSWRMPHGQIVVALIETAAAGLAVIHIINVKRSGSP